MKHVAYTNLLIDDDNGWIKHGTGPAAAAGANTTQLHGTLLEPFLRDPERLDAQQRDDLWTRQRNAG